ncbi:MAG: helix-turn-helix domain-containing protein [Bacteroidales bacterium]|nr:helix-turn-helix domain-containing protein [Bacteroidales bacterium]
MSIKELLSSEAHISIVVTPADLREFAISLINETLAAKSEQKPVEEYLQRSEAARILGVSTNTLWRWAKDGYLSPVKIGHKSAYKLSDINKIRQLNSL